MYALSLINGPHIDDWVHKQVQTLRTRSQHAQNPIPRTEEQHWDDFKQAFESAWTDTAKEQTAVQKPMALKMYKNDIDTYISTFENLASEAGYNHDAKGTIHLFAQGLQPNLLRTKPSQCFAVLGRLTWHKSNKLPNNLKIIYIIV